MTAEDALSTLTWNMVNVSLLIIATQASGSGLRERTNKAFATDGVVFGKESQALNFQDHLFHDLGKVGKVIVTEDDGTCLQERSDKIQKEKYSGNHY